MSPLLVTLAFPILLLIGYGLAYQLSGRNERLLLGPAGFFLYQAILAVPLGSVLLSHPDLVAQAFVWHPSTPAWLVGGLLVGLALWWLQRHLPGRVPDSSSQVWTGPPGAIGFLLLLLPVAYIVLAEEIVWRAFLLPRIGLVLSSAAFALHHYHFGWRHLVFSFLAGLCWGGLMVGAETVWPGVLSHLVYNALAWRHMRRQAALRDAR